MEHVMDNEIITLRNNWQRSCTDQPNYKTLCKQSITTQEYIFGEYFTNGNQLQSCPDLILHLGTNVHDMGRRTSKMYRIAIVWMYPFVSRSPRLNSGGILVLNSGPFF